MTSHLSDMNAEPLRRRAPLARLFAGLALAACGSLQSGRDPMRDGATLLIRDVSVVDVEAGRVVPHSSVLIAGSRIAAVGTSERITAAAGTPTVDGRGRYLIPGLWDMHSHSLWETTAMTSFLPQYVAAGVTGIRDMGGRLAVLAAYRAAMRDGAPLWPRVIAAGEILDGPTPVQPDISIGVNGAVMAEHVVDSLADAGVDFIKVYTLLPHDAYLGVVRAAKRRGLPVVGHLPAEVAVEEAMRAGQRSIEHLRDEIDVFCSSGDVAECRTLAAGLRSAGIWQVPTLITLSQKAYYDDPADTLDPRLDYLPEALRREWLGDRRNRLRRSADEVAARRERYARAEWVTAFFAREGVPLLVGTDAGNPFVYPGSSVHDELRLFVHAGLTPLQALRAATLEPARLLSAADSMGSIATGRVADLVLLRRDPLVDITATREVDAVVLRGRWLDRAKLDRLRESARTGQRRPAERRPISYR